MIGSAAVESRREGHLRSRVTVVRVDAKRAQQTRKERETLLPLRLKPLDMRAWAINSLCLLVCPACVVVIGDEGCDRIDRTMKFLKEVTGLQDTQRLKVMLGENVEVIRQSRHKVGIAGRNGRIRSLVWIDHRGWYQVADVGPGEAAAVDDTQIAVLLQL